MSNYDKNFNCKVCGTNELRDLRSNLCTSCKEKLLNEKHLCECGCGTLINRWNLSHNGNIREVKALNLHGNAKCNFKEYSTLKEYLQNNTCPVCHKVLFDKRTLHRHIDKNRCIKKEDMTSFINNWNSKCHCGCGNKTKTGRLGYEQHSESDPWNKGLTKHDDVRLKDSSIRRIDEMGKLKNLQYMANTSIEIIIRELLDYNKIPYIQQYSFYYEYLCDFALPQYKLIIECDGNYWHNYPHGKDKDREQTKFVESKGWHMLRFWESDIKNNIDKCIKELNDKIIEICA